MLEGAPCQMPLYSISLEAYAQARQKPSCAGLPRGLLLALLPTLGPPARPETELPVAFPGCLPQCWDISLVAHHPWRRVSLFPSHRYIPASMDGERQETQQGPVHLPRGLEQSWPKPQIATKSQTGSGWERRGRKKKQTQKTTKECPGLSKEWRPLAMLYTSLLSGRREWKEPYVRVHWQSNHLENFHSGEYSPGNILELHFLWRWSIFLLISTSLWRRMKEQKWENVNSLSFPLPPP